MAKKVQAKTELPLCCQEQLMALQDGLYVLGGKWKMMILLYLYNRKDEPNHFKKIQRDIAGISAKMLTKELRDLESNLLISRIAQESPIMVLYALTDYGFSTIDITKNITAFGLTHRKKIKEKR